MNNKGQVLVTFIILLPMVCILFGYVLDKCYLLYQQKELKDIADVVCKYALKEEKSETEMKQLALENDKEIEKIAITRKDNSVQLVLEKKEKSLFSRLVGKDSYQIKVKITCKE